MTDGSLFFSPTPKSYLIIQSPVHIPENSSMNQVKLKRFKVIFCYSNFVREFIKSRLNYDALVIAPPVLTDVFKPLRKENIIISVGRFFPWLHSKKQEILIEGFKRLLSLDEFKKWRLVLIGSVDRGAERFFKEIKDKARGLPIEIISNASNKLLAEFYGKAKIYWHATGFGEDLSSYPERAEHFGISTVEAMAAGCVPVVFNGGGQREIVKEGRNGYLWETIPDLIKKTKLAKNPAVFNNLARRAREDSKKYSKEEFIKKIEKLVG
jgi:glycosyltransferase involved in cell wall biosynthesis